MSTDASAAPSKAAAAAVAKKAAPAPAPAPAKAPAPAAAAKAAPKAAPKAPAPAPAAAAAKAKAGPTGSAAKAPAPPEPEPEPAAPTSGPGTPKTFQVNRNSVFKQYLLGAGWRAAEPHERAQLAHWDAHTKNGPANAEINCFPRAATNCIDNIWTYFKRVEAIGMANDGFPETFFEWRELDKATIESSPIWFLKQVWGVHGNGINLVGSWEDYQKAVKDTPKKATFVNGPSGKREDIADSYYLQRGLCNCHLYEGRKYLLRVYYLALGDGSVCVYDDALGYAHGTPFDAGEKTWRVHVSHVNVPGKDEGHADDRIYFTLSEQPFGAEVMAKIMEHSKRHLPILQETITVSQGHAKPENRVDASRYHMWGVDYLVGDDDGKLSVWCIELNAFPNMNHNNPRKGGKKQQNEIDFRAAGFDRDMMRKIGLEKQDATKNKWVEVLPAFAKK